METVITAIVDELSEIVPWVQKKRFFIILATCASMAVIGLPLCFEVRIYKNQQKCFVLYYDIDFPFNLIAQPPPNNVVNVPHLRNGELNCRGKTHRFEQTVIII